MKIAILGGGVAGVSTAIALTQKGFDVAIYERRSAPTDVGAGIVIWPNAAYVLDQLDVLNDMAALSGRPTHMRRLSLHGEELGSMDILDINRRMGYPSLSVLRRDLQRVLLAKLDALGFEIRYGHAVADIEQEGRDRSCIRFGNGAQAMADVVIGAEGRMDSPSRRYVHGDSRPVYQGFINWVGVYEAQEDVFTDMAVRDYWGVGERFGIVPVSKRTAYWAGAIVSKSIEKSNLELYKKELLSVFSAWPSPVAKVIEETPIESIHKVYVHDHDPIGLWHKRNVIVIGDAAHAPLPTSGQGACQALEDAWHLANCLQENPRDLDAAFTAFTALRSEKTADIIRAGRSLAAALFNTDASFCEARNASSKSSNFAEIAKGMAQFWGRGLPLNA
ncbi:FAD-dependent oxidoreductase [Hahella sp. HN01]|uniref:FAD-dependent oxidoreductase n=1 Tax=Hahella sp. HN01 TaxID=2847262 RepID=UPI001C1EA666|nr:FAD-dependent oxidoreductase [Hahella sp. HN01]MBU6952991.1 FAD-dependent oxidoreductase [Hahella sp. HN01]